MFYGMLTATCPVQAPSHTNKTLPHPADYRWSSYTGYAQGADNELIEAHPQYIALGKNNKERQANYRELFRYQLDSQMIDQIRSATNSNYALGDSRFHDQIAEALGRRVTPGKPGRPRKIVDHAK